MGLVLDSQDRKIELEFRMTLVPPSLKFSVYMMSQYTSYTLNSERFDFKSRATEEDLESRRDWASSDSQVLLGDVFVIEPIDSRGKQIELSVKVSWDPCFAVIKWLMNGCHVRIAVRPSPPYRSWVRDYLAPVTWDVAVKHADSMIRKSIASRQPAPKLPEPSSSSSQPPVIHQSQDQFCQTQCILTNDGFCQTVSRSFSEIGVGPDLIHLETTIVPYFPVEYYHPPWPTVWVHVVDELGVIHAVVPTIPTPVEEEVTINQFPPETTHEVTTGYPMNPLTPPPRRPFGRPPPPPFHLFRPEPPVERPGYIPIPPGIRAVYTLGATLLRSQPELNHPRRLITPRIREGINALSDRNVIEIAQHWALRTNENPEVNPHI